MPTTQSAIPPMQFQCNWLSVQNTLQRSLVLTLGCALLLSTF
ncbi:hypothetical protein QWZ13_16420 [Reinekea marina]|nr:hypothetical protein [Reinekea marina]MDN3650493.1 hypothetical protein [Reinekea marina]